MVEKRFKFTFMENFHYTILIVNTQYLNIRHFNLHFTNNQCFYVLVLVEVIFVHCLVFNVNQSFDFA